jgi:hypothetical protein
MTLLTRRLLLTLAGGSALAACQPVSVGGGGPTIDASAPVPVALLVPRGSGNPGDDVLASNLENAARLAIGDLSGVSIDLKVYDSGASAATSAAAAVKAVDEGARIILGPVYADGANAAGLAVAARGVNVLSFSNNASIAGGNVFVLGNLFENSAARLASYAVRQGKRTIVVVNGNGGAELIVRDAAVAAIRGAGGTVGGTVGFELSQQGVVNAAPEIVAQVRGSGADAVFFTSGTDGALPLLAQILPEQGLGAGTVQWIGLQRWDIPANARELPGLQGGWFALPDPALTTRFRERYAAAFGGDPHPIAGLAYDGIAAVGALVKSRGANALTGAALTQGAGFVGVNGIFRFTGNGTNQRGLAVAQIQNQSVVVIDPAPRSFGGAGL